MDVMGIDACACACWGHWQVSASAGLVPGGCVTVTPVVSLAVLCVGKSSEHPACSGP